MQICSTVHAKPFNKNFCLTTLFLISSLILSNGAAADTIWLKNGDKISGKIENLDNDLIGVNTEYAGLIYLQLDQVKSVENHTSADIQDKKLSVSYQADNPDNDQLDNSNETETESDTAVTQPVFYIWDKSNWQVGLDLNLNQKIATSRTEYYKARLNTRFRHGNWQHKLDAGFNRKRDNHKTKAHEYGADFSSDRFITEKFFWQGRTMYKRDHIEDVSRQMAIGTGPGYQLWDDDNGSFSLSGLLGRTRYDYIDQTAESFNSVSLRWDYNRYLLDEDIELYTKGELTRPLNSETNISLDASIGMRYYMTKWLSWFIDHSRNLISGGRQEMDERRISTGLGLKW